MKLVEALKFENTRLLLQYVSDYDAEILTAAGFEHLDNLDRTDTAGELVESWSNTRFLECVFDLAYEVGYRAASGQYLADDSRVAFQLVLSWAREFESSFTRDMDENGEYLERIADFAAQKFAEQEE